VTRAQTKTRSRLPAVQGVLRPAATYPDPHHRGQSITDSVVTRPRSRTRAGFVASRVGLSQLSTVGSTEVKYLHGARHAAYGGTPQLALTVLKAGPPTTSTQCRRRAAPTSDPVPGEAAPGAAVRCPPSFTALTPLRSRPRRGIRPHRPHLGAGALPTDRNRDPVRLPPEPARQLARTRRPSQTAH